MFLNYFKIAWRNILKQRMYALVTIVGLSIGLSIFFFFFRLYDWARSVDTFHTDVDRIHCVVQKFSSTAYGKDHLAFVPSPLPSALKEEIPEIREITRIYRAGRIIVSSEQNRFYENHIICVDPNFMSFFNFPLLSGDRDSLFEKPNSVVLSRSLADKYFGQEQPIGKILTINNQMDVTVTGVVMDWMDLPSSSSITFSMLLSQEAGENLFHISNDWTLNDQTAFVRLQRNVDPVSLTGRLDDFVQKYYPEGTERQAPQEIYFIPLRQIYYFAPHIRKYDSANFSAYSVFLGLGFLFLLLVCMNYVNLATSRALDRVKEIGLRKVVGANRKQLIRQFLCESVLIAFLALPMSFLGYELISTTLMARMGLVFNLSLWSRTIPVLAVFLVPLITGVLSGIYPAFVLSSFRPIQMFKSRGSKKGRRRIQKIMVVSQFVLCSVFLVLGFVWFKQTRHIFKADLGYDRSGVWAINLSEETYSRHDLFRERMEKSSEISAVSASRGLPGNWRTKMNVTTSSSSGETGWTMYAYGVDYGFFNLLHMNVPKGRVFSRAFNDDNSYIINQSAAALLGWKDPIGKSINVEKEEGRIIGIVGDFRFENVYYPSSPALFYLEKEHLDFFLVRASHPANHNELIEDLRDNWSAVMSDVPFEFISLDDHFNDVYFNETTLISEVISSIGGFAVFLSCLGLLALASYSIRIRTKEIAVRKVLGASNSGIFGLLGRDFLKYVFLSDLIALPIAYFVSFQMLASTYTVRTTIGAGILLLTAFLTFSAAFAAIVSQTLKAARTNPVDFLHQEQ